MRFRGREITHSHIGREKLEQFEQELNRNQYGGAKTNHGITRYDYGFSAKHEINQCKER